MSDLWVPFHVALAIVAESIGSKVLAWDELPRLLKEGHVRAIAECTDVHEVTGEHMRTYEAPIPTTWWMKHGRFRRSLIDSKMYLMTEAKSQYEDQGLWFHHPHLYDNIRILKSDLERYAPNGIAGYLAKAASQPGETASRPQLATRKPGRRPGKIEAVIAAMKQVPRAELEAMLEKKMEQAFGASRDTCRKARDRVLSKTLN